MTDSLTLQKKLTCNVAPPYLQVCTPTYAPSQGNSMGMRKLSARGM